MMPDVWVTAVIGPLCILVVGWWLEYKRRKDNKTHQAVLERVHQQVENSHKRNLRDDIDVLHDLMSETNQGLRKVRDEVRWIRQDISDLKASEQEQRMESRNMRADLRDLNRQINERNNR